MRLAKVLLVIAFQLVVASRTPVAWACTCRPASDQEYFNQAEVVFTGTVVGRDDPNAGSQARSSSDSIVWTFHVDRIYKGEAAEQQAVRSAMSGASCGFEFAMAQRYEVFARTSDGALTTGLCDGNRQLAEGATPVAPAGAGPRSPKPAATPRPTPAPTTSSAPTATASIAPTAPAPTSTPVAAPAPRGTERQGSGIALAAGIAGVLLASATVIAWRRLR
jgi:cell division septation protein DedD